MRFNLPLLPCQVEIRRRPLTWPRLTIGKGMIVVGVAAILTSLIVKQRRLAWAMGNYSRQISANFDFDDLVRFQRTHNEVQTAFLRNDLLLFLAIITTVAVVVLFLVGRAIDWWLRRSGR